MANLALEYATGDKPTAHKAARSAAGYSQVEREDNGGVQVLLADDHPGIRDPLYRERRNQLAEYALDWRPGDPVPTPSYRHEEHDIWRQVSAALHKRFATYTPKAFQEAVEELALPTERVPQLTEVTDRLLPLAGFRYYPVAGLAPLREFYESFASGVFYSTQYLRHPSAPLYTPEPDLVHEVIGHANQLAIPFVARLYRSVGRAVTRCETEEALMALSKVFWFTIEFGVVHEHGAPKAFGAGLLSSAGELDEFRRAHMRPVDLKAMATADYDITRFQPELFMFASLTEIEDILGDFLANYDDESYARLVR